MSIKVAIQLYSLRDLMNADPIGTLKKVRDAGYEGVEFAGLYGMSAAEMKSALKDVGLTPVSAHISLREFMSDLDGTMEKYREIGCEYVAVPFLPPEKRPGTEEFYDVVKYLGTIGEAAVRHGVTLLYHNHDFEFKKLGDEYAIDYIYKTVPADLLKVEPDVCWVDVAGVDPAEFIGKYSGRCPVVHIKDHNGARGSASYNLIGRKENTADTGDFDYRAVGDGVVNIKAVLEASEKAGTEWFVVEFDTVPKNTSDEIDCARKSRGYLAKAGY